MGMDSMIAIIVLVSFIGMIIFFSGVMSLFNSLKEIKEKLRNIDKATDLFNIRLKKIEGKLETLLEHKEVISGENGQEAKAPATQAASTAAPHIFTTPEVSKSEPVIQEPIKTETPKQESILPPPIPAASNEKPMHTAPVFKEEPVSAFEENAGKILNKIWNWITVGEEFRDKKVSMEYSIASTWLLRSAIIIILTGSAFFLKYSIDNNMITPMGRVTVSILFALLMLISGLKIIGKKYSLIGQGLSGGGLALFYFSIFAASGMYKLIGIIPSFALMTLVTVAAGIISVRVNSLLIAILGVIGGYCTPIMLNTGVKNLEGLFSYLTLLGIGTLYIAKNKNWKLLNFMAFAFTYLLYFAAMNKYDSKTDFTVAFSFLTVFFLLFSVVNLIYNIIRKENATLIELGMAFVNTCIYFASAYYLVNPLYGKNYIALLCISLAVFYIAQIWYFMKAGIQDKNQLIINSGFASFFITLTIPFLFTDEWITAAWSIQALVFIWMSIKLKSKFVRAVSYVIYMIILFRLSLFDCQHNFISTTRENYWSEMFSRLITIGSYIASLAGAWKLLSMEQSKNPAKAETDVQNPIIAMFIILSGFTLFIYMHIEVYYFTKNFYLPGRMPLFTAIWLAGLIFAGIKIYKGSKSPILQPLALILLAGVFIKFAVLDLLFWNVSIGEKCFNCNFEIESIIMRALDFCPLIAVLGILFVIFRKKSVAHNHLFGIASLILLFIYLTLETGTFMLHFMPGMKPGAISVLWGLFAFFLILGGIIKNIKALRFTGLALFVITIFKIFFFDMSHLTPVYKFSAFIALGIVILVGALIYVRFKDLFNLPTSDKKETTNEK